MTSWSFNYRDFEAIEVAGNLLGILEMFTGCCYYDDSHLLHFLMIGPSETMLKSESKQRPQIKLELFGFSILSTSLSQ